MTVDNFRFQGIDVYQSYSLQRKNETIRMIIHINF